MFDVNVIFAPATVSCIQMQRVAYGEKLGFFQEARKSVELVRSESLRLLATAPRLSNSLFVAVYWRGLTAHIQDHVVWRRNVLNT